MKRFPVALALVLLCLPVFAQTAPAPAPKPAVVDPWHAGTEELILQGTFGRDQLTQHWLGTAAFVWAHFVTDNTEVGTVVSYDANVAATGTGAGAFYEWAAARVGKGDVILGGDAQRLTGDLNQAATYQYTTRVGYKAHVGKNAAFRFSVDMQRALQQKDQPASDFLNGVSFVVGLSVALPQ